MTKENTITNIDVDHNLINLDVLKQLAEIQKELAELGVDISEPTFYDLRSPFDDQKLPILRISLDYYRLARDPLGIVG